MIRMITAYTTEIDEIDVAVEEILTRIDLESLEKNAAGIIYCHYEFIESGVVGELCNRLPFDVIGLTTVSTANKDFYGMYGLSLTVLTSDEVTFATSFTQALSADDYDLKIAAAYEEAQGKLSGDPAMIISCFPYIRSLSGAHLVSAFDKRCGGIPIFGSICFGTNMGYENSRTILNGEAKEDALAMLLLQGPVEPEFNAISLPDHDIRGSRALVTESEDCLLIKVNDTPILKYLESIGFVAHKGAPLMVYYPGSLHPVASGIFTVNEDGSVLCGCEIPIGASIAIGEVNRNGVLETAAESIEAILSSKKKNGALIFPCTARYFTLFPGQDDEMKLVSEALFGKIPYMLGYSGGEICPVMSEDGTLHNRFHSFTFCSCVF